MGNRTTSLKIPPTVNVSITYYWNDLGDKPSIQIDYSKVFSAIQTQTGLDPLRLCVEKKEGFCQRNCQTSENAKPVIIVIIKPESGTLWDDRYAETIKKIVNNHWSSIYGVESCCIEISCDVS